MRGTARLSWWCSFTTRFQTSQVRRNIEFDIKATPLVVLYCGSNDLRFGHSPSEIADNIREIASLIGNRNPETRLIVVGVWRVILHDDVYDNKTNVTANSCIRFYSLQLSISISSLVEAVVAVVVIVS